MGICRSSPPRHYLSGVSQRLKKRSINIKARLKQFNAIDHAVNVVVVVNSDADVGCGCASEIVIALR